MYHPNLGRFIQRDPIGFESGDVNLYRYVGNHPTNAVDPSGLAEPAKSGWKEILAGAREFGIPVAMLLRLQELNQTTFHRWDEQGRADALATKEHAVLNHWYLYMGYNNDERLSRGLSAAKPGLDVYTLSGIYNEVFHLFFSQVIMNKKDQKWAWARNLIEEEAKRFGKMIADECVAQGRSWEIPVRAPTYADAISTATALCGREMVEEAMSEMVDDIVLHRLRFDRLPGNFGTPKHNQPGEKWREEKSPVLYKMANTKVSEKIRQLTLWILFQGDRDPAAGFGGLTNKPGGMTIEQWRNHILSEHASILHHRYYRPDQ